MKQHEKDPNSDFTRGFVFGLSFRPVPEVIPLSELEREMETLKWELRGSIHEMREFSHKSVFLQPWMDIEVERICKLARRRCLDRASRAARKGAA